MIPLRCRIWLAGLLTVAFATYAGAHSLYVGNDNHTDYGWNDSVPNYENSMVNELTYYRGRIDATAANPVAERTRYIADCWYYMYLYDPRTPTPLVTSKPTQAMFNDLILKMQQGSIMTTLNPFVELYGALPTEAAIRAAFYPARLERQYGIRLLAGREEENQTIPWGISSVWFGEGAKYSWKGICNCATSLPSTARTDGEVFRWQGPDNNELLMKWYYSNPASNSSWGGYAEARDAILKPSSSSPTPASGTAQAELQRAIDHLKANMPGLPLTGLFGEGWDDVSWQKSLTETVVHDWNLGHPTNPAYVSNGIDYFQALEPYRATLPQRRGGLGIDWDLWPTGLSDTVAKSRDAIEQLHAIEALATVVHIRDRSFWSVHQPELEAGLMDFYKIFEHNWPGLFGGVPIADIINWKHTWQADLTTKFGSVLGTARSAFGALFRTPNETRFVVFNPLAFPRTDVADVALATAGSYVVTDVETGAEVPNQIVVRSGNTYLRILATNVPSLGYRTYRYVSGTPTAFPNAATISANRIESDLYRVDLGTRGELTSVFEKLNARELAGTSKLNDFGSGSSTGSPSAENVGPVSATLFRTVSDTPSRTVRITLFKNVNRVDIEDQLTGPVTSNQGSAPRTYSFDVNLTNPQIHEEEIGAIMRPGFVGSGGDYLPGARTDYVTVNHFVDFASSILPSYHIALSNWDAFTMKLGNSTLTSFALPTSTAKIVAVGNIGGNNGTLITDQGGATSFLHRFALSGLVGAFSGSQSMQAALAHQNPLEVVGLAPNQSGTLTAPSASFLSVTPANVVLTAVKPVEEGDRGIFVRLWELDGVASTFTVDASAFAPVNAYRTTLTETDTGPATLTGGGVLSGTIGANEMQGYRLSLPAAPSSCGAIGDLDCSGTVDILDLQRLVNILLGLETDPAVIARADLDGQNGATVLDLQLLVNKLLGV